MLYKNLLPRKIMFSDSFDKMSNIMLGIQLKLQEETDKISNAYNIDKLEEDDLLKMIASFSLLDLYQGLPPYYRGASENAAGDPYPIPILPKVPFMRKFLRQMLLLRKDLGVYTMFDKVMGLLGQPTDQYLILQDFTQTASGQTVPYAIKECAAYVSDEFKAAHQIGGSWEAWLALYYSLVPGSDDIFTTDSGGSAQAFYTPTNTIRAEVIRTVDTSIQSEFMQALRSIITFLKPVHVVLKDLPATVYLETTGFVGLMMSNRGVVLLPTASAGTTSIDCAAVAATNKLTGTGFLTAGIKQGMLLTITGFTDPANNLTNARVDSVTETELTFVATEATLADESSTTVTIDFDYDHSWQDGRTKRDGYYKDYLANDLTISDTAKTIQFPNDLAVEGFKVGDYISIYNWGDPENCIKNVKIVSSVGAVATLAYTGTLVDGLNTGAVRIYAFRNPDNMAAVAGAAGPGPVMEKAMHVSHPSMHQPGMLPTVASGGSYNKDGASERLDVLDKTHFNNLNARAGGSIYFGFCVQDEFVILSGKVHRTSGSWLDDGFEDGCLISITGFVTNPGNNVTMAKVQTVSELDLLMATAILVDEDPGADVTVCVDMLPKKPVIFPYDTWVNGDTGDFKYDGDTGDPKYGVA